MTNLRILVIVAAAAIVAVLAGGWFVGVQPMLASASAADESAASAESQNQMLQVKVASLSREAAKTGAMQAQDAVLQKAVPSILKDNTFNRRINEVAALNGITVTGVSLGTASAYTSPVTTTTPVAPSDAATPSASASPAATTAPVTAASAAPVIARTDPLITSANFATVPVSITATGTEEALLAFSTAIQDDERTFLINSVVTARGDDGTTTATFNGFIYTLQR